MSANTCVAVELDLCRVVMDSFDGRRIVFTCFHPEICVALRLKQAR